MGAGAWSPPMASTAILMRFSAIRLEESALTRVALFLFLLDGDDQLALVEPAARAHAVRDMQGSALGALGEPGKHEPLPVGPAAVSTGCAVMFFWISHKSPFI